MTTADHRDEIPHPPSRPFVGNLPDIDPDHVIESLMRLAREYGPIYRLDAPGGKSRLIVSGFDLVDELCDDARFDKTLGPAVDVVGSRWQPGPVHRHDRRPELVEGPQHPAARTSAWPAMQRYFPMMLDLAVQLVPEVGPPQPGRDDRRLGRHDPPDARHDRALRLRLPLQLVLPRDAAPVRGGDGARPGAVPGPVPAAADPDPAQLARPAAARGRTTPT